MAKTHDLTDTVMPSAVMTEEEIAAWNSLSHEEQMLRMDKLFQDPDCLTPSDRPFEQVLERAKARIKSARA